MNEQEIKRKFPRASKSFVAINAGADGLPSRTDTERSVRNGTLAARKGEKNNATRRLVSITSFRAILADADALCGKYFVDALRYAGIIPDDTENDIIYQIRQRKVDKKTQEKTLIQVT